MNNDLHKAQASILKELLFNNGTNFTALNKLDLDTYHFNFHLKRLIASGYVEKTNKKYSLTQAGKTFASKLDIFSLKMERQGTASVAIAAKKKVHGQDYYLVQQRLKEPFYGYYGFINGKIHFGETSLQTANREFKEETGLTGTPKILCVYHKIRGPKPTEIKLDNFFFVYVIKNPKGILKDTIEGKNNWVTLTELKQLKKFPGFASLLKIVETEKYTPYFEEFIKVDNI